MLRLFLLSLMVMPCAHAQMESRDYEWNYAGRQLKFNLQFEASQVRALKKVARVREDFTAYVMEPSQRPLLDFVVSQFRGFAQQNRWSDSQTISMMIAFVQSLPYTHDNATTGHDEYPRYPLETLADNGGDCEDTAILLAALLHAMKYDVVLLKGPGHMAVGVGVSPKSKPLGNYSMTMLRQGNRNYAYLETTGDGFQLGEFPSKCRATPADFRIVPLVVKPIVDLEVKGKPAGTQMLLDIQLRNMGSAPAKMFVQSRVEVDPVSASVPDSRSKDFQLRAGEGATLQMACDLPLRFRRCRLLVEAVDSQTNTSLKLWQSQWVEAKNP
jgi:hypothetical protein